MANDDRNASTITLARPWIMIVGATLGAATLLFFMALVLLGVMGREVPCNSIFLVNITLSLGAALSVAFLGGNASARGAISIPFFQKNPLVFSLSGGTAVLLIMLLTTTNLFGKSCGGTLAISCPPGFQAHTIETLRFGFCYPREGWEVDNGPIGINAADIYLRYSANRDIGIHFHVSLIPAGWANRASEYSAQTLNTWKQLDSNAQLARNFIGGRDAFEFSLRVKDRVGRSRPTTVTHIYLDHERLLETIATWFTDTPAPVIDDMSKVKSSLTFARV